MNQCGLNLLPIYLTVVQGGTKGAIGFVPNHFMRKPVCVLWVDAIMEQLDLFTRQRSEIAPCMNPP